MRRDGRVTLPPVERIGLTGGAVARVRRQPRQDPHAAPLVLLTAWPQTLRCWDGHWPGLVDTGREVLAVELPGFGRTPPTTRDRMRPSAQAGLLAELLARLLPDPAVVVGPDVGVPIALRLAVDHPDLVAGVVVSDGPGTSPPNLSWEGRLLARSRLVRVLATPAGPLVLEELTRRGYRGGRPGAGALLDHLRSAASWRRFAGQLAFVASYGDELPALHARLGDVRAPTLVVWGAEDPIVLPAEARAIARAVPDARLRILAGCSHYLHEDAGDRFTGLLTEWLAERVDPVPVA